MLAYNMRLALNSFKRNPGLTALMVGAIGLGIATCVVTMTVYHAMSGDPIWWKSDRLYAVTMDNWDPNRPYDLALSAAASAATHLQGRPPHRRLGNSAAPRHHAQGPRRVDRRNGAAPARARHDTNHVSRFLCRL